MPSLEVVSPVEDEVVSAFTFDTEPGATVSISGFHGTQTYTLSAHDQTLIIRFTGVTEFTDSAPAGESLGTKQRAVVPEGAPEGEEGAEETDAEQMQRENAERAAEANDKKAGKDKRVTLVDDQGTARTYVMVEEEAAPKAKAAAPQPAQHTEKAAEKK